jgi:hypothetical protein
MGSGKSYGDVNSGGGGGSATAGGGGGGATGGLSCSYVRVLERLRAL